MESNQSISINDEISDKININNLNNFENYQTSKQIKLELKESTSQVLNITKIVI